MLYARVRIVPVEISLRRRRGPRTRDIASSFGCDAVTPDHQRHDQGGGQQHRRQPRHVQTCRETPVFLRQRARAILRGAARDFHAGNLPCEGGHVGLQCRQSHLHLRRFRDRVFAEAKARFRAQAGKFGIGIGTLYRPGASQNVAALEPGKSRFDGIFKRRARQCEPIALRLAAVRARRPPPCARLARLGR